MLDHPVGKRVLQLIQSSLVAGEFFPDVGLELVGSIGNHHLIFGSPHASSPNLYIEGKTKGRFSSPLNPTFISPLP